MKKTMPIAALLLVATNQQPAHAEDAITVLNFQGDNGYQHESKDEALGMVELLGKKNGWKVVSSADPATLESEKLARFDVIVFNNNCGTAGRIFSDDQQKALQAYIRGGGGFVGIHCAGAIWKEGGEFQKWYEKLIGTKLVAHPHVQTAKLIVEHQGHLCTAHLPKEWIVKDEWHKFSYNPREHVNVLSDLDFALGPAPRQREDASPGSGAGADLRDDRLDVPVQIPQRAHRRVGVNQRMLEEGVVCAGVPVHPEMLRGCTNWTRASRSVDIFSTLTSPVTPPSPRAGDQCVGVIGSTVERRPPAARMVRWLLLSCRHLPRFRRRYERYERYEWTRTAAIIVVTRASALPTTGRGCSPS